MKQLEPRVAITTDWLTSFGGAERVLEQLRVLYPGAPIYTSVYDPSALPGQAASWDVRPSFLQRLPFITKYSRATLPLMSAAFGRFDLSGYDAVISVSAAFAKNVRTTTCANVCYCLTPPRYLWDLHDDYVRGRLGRPALNAAAHWLRRMDLAAAGRVHDFIAISETVAERVRRTYSRDASVIYPPVDTARIRPTNGPAEDFYLVVSRLVAYKRIDLAVQACTQLDRRLLVVGVGPERRKLEAMAGPTVQFLGRLDDAEVELLYARCKAFIFPGLEDFGITPVEAQAAGRPVIAFGRGGAAETVIDGGTGVHFQEQSVDALIDAIERLEREEVRSEACRANALRFDASIFRDRMSAAVDATCRSGRVVRAESGPSSLAAEYAD